MLYKPFILSASCKHETIFAHELLMNIIVYVYLHIREMTTEYVLLADLSTKIAPTAGFNHNIRSHIIYNKTTNVRYLLSQLQ